MRTARGVGHTVRAAEACGAGRHLAVQAHQHADHGGEGVRCYESGGAPHPQRFMSAGWRQPWRTEAASPESAAGECCR